MSRQRLWVVFWFYDVLVRVALNVIAYVWSESAFFVICFGFLYTLGLMTAEWRSAFNVNHKILGYLARSYVVLQGLLLIGIMWGGMSVLRDIQKSKDERKLAIINHEACATATKQYQDAINSGSNPVEYIKSHSKDFKNCPNGLPARKALQ